MRKTTYIIFFFILSHQFFGQAGTNTLVDTKWDSDYSKGEFGDGFKMVFSATTVTISNGPNTYIQFKYYKLRNDTLIIAYTSPIDPKKAKHPFKNYSVFKVTKFEPDSLLLKALNWQALYITGVLTTPYIDVDSRKFPKLDQKLKPGTDFSQGGAMNDQIDLYRQK